MKIRKTIMCAVVCLCAALLTAASAVVTTSAVQRRLVDYTEDFSSAEYTDGLDIRDGSPLNRFWAVDQFVNADHSFIGCDENNRLVLNVQGYLGMLSSSEMFDTYTYSTTLRVAPGNSGSFMVSARHGGANPHGSLFEADHYRENNPDDPNAMTLDRTGFLHDYSGFCVFPTALTNAAGEYLMVLDIKTFVDDGHHYVANAYYDLYVDRNLTEYFTLSFEDNGETITLKLDGETLCTVEMSDRGTYKGEASDTAEYFRHALIRLPDGETALEVDNARLAANARVALAARTGKASVASIEVHSQSTEAPETDTPAPGTAASTEAGTVPEAVTDAPTEADTAAGTDVTPETEANSEASADTAVEPETQAHENGHSRNTDLILFCVFGVLELLLIAVLAVLVLKKP